MTKSRFNFDPLAKEKALARHAARMGPAEDDDARPDPDRDPFRFINLAVVGSWRWRGAR